MLIHTNVISYHAVDGKVKMGQKIDDWKKKNDINVKSSLVYMHYYVLGGGMEALSSC